MGALFIFFPFQFLDFQVERSTPDFLGIRNTMGFSAANSILEFQRYTGFWPFVDQKRLKFSDNFGGMFRGCFPNMFTSMILFFFPVFCDSKASPKKGMENFQGPWVDLRNGYFKKIAITFSSMLDRDTTLAVKESRRPDYPMVSRHRGKRLGSRWNQLTARLIRQEVGASVSSPSEIMHGAHSVAVTWAAAIIDSAKSLFSSHDIIISSKQEFVNGLN